ncbi:hypothetical protein E2562_034141 [Oryza meyeriana var. granulata]|uniref:DUF834 domain-containing protein n=1 Tax=Oryza meyeriana var. granulata TaxID=110450 RepID=A0A6G1CW57_9ORYZ|nr:hypothetical protein E2562_034141 [Oryza meyeriana var. granulata]
MSWRPCCQSSGSRALGSSGGDARSRVMMAVLLELRIWWRLCWAVEGHDDDVGDGGVRRPMAAVLRSIRFGGGDPQGWRRAGGGHEGHGGRAASTGAWICHRQASGRPWEGCDGGARQQQLHQHPDGNRI